jgi:demethylmenaquinone methyltransferase/2-methoxy-6-polyprenyl-1,4-benzoquinol methylase
MAERPAPPGNPVPPADVRAMFDRIAPIYDRMNTVMSFGLDAGWRRAAARATRLQPGMVAVDVACGSGALTRELARAVGRSGMATGVDVSSAMLRRAAAIDPPAGAAEPRYVAGDARGLPFDDGSADAATIAFGLRNVSDYRAALAEMARVTRPGGRVVVLEIATPSRGRAAAELWFRGVVPLIGRAAGRRDAYRYLPDSVQRYPAPATVAGMMREAGLSDVRWCRLGFGMVTLHAGTRPT